MTETSHSRSRSAALIGLVTQTAVMAGVFVLGVGTHFQGLLELAWMLLGGVPIWLAALLVFRQHELAELEALDLETLRREKQSTGMFEEEGGAALNLRVAQARLEWMQQWLLPSFALIVGAFLVTTGVLRFQVLRGLGLFSEAWPAVRNPGLTLMFISLALLVLFFCARYASGLGRLPQWRLMRACGSYMLGCALAAGALAVCLGVELYQGSTTLERLIAFAIPVLMVVLGLETLVNFVADRYRPRLPGVEPRASFDSRLLGLISEPGGIAQSVAEAINYQFGFRVSQTWFYVLLQRALVPLVIVGGLALWALSGIVVVWPHQHAIVERLGRQLDPERPLGPGFHFKLPSPVDVAYKFNTGQIQQFHIGFQTGDQPVEAAHGNIELWTDTQHSGREHFNFVLPPTPSPEGERDAAAVQTPVHMARIEVFVQYRIDADRLADYTRSAADADTILRSLAWDEVSRVAASTNIDQMMGERLETLGATLTSRLNQRLDQAALGLRIVHVGVSKIHPENTVSEAFRGVVKAQLERVAEVRRARVTESELLSKVAGDPQRARSLVEALDAIDRLSSELSRHELRLQRRGLSIEQQRTDAVKALSEAITARTDAEAARDQARRRRDDIEDDIRLGIGRALRERAAAIEAAEEAERTYAAAAAAYEQAAAPLRERLAQQHGADAAAELLAAIESTVALDAWNLRLEQRLAGLEGDAAVVLAGAQAGRWKKELTAESELTRVRRERDAYEAAPNVYRARAYLRVLGEGMREARKMFLAFEPGERTVHLRLETQDQARPDVGSVPVRIEE